MSEARIDRLTEDIRDIKETLARLEPMIIRIDATLPHLATKAELTTGLSELRVAIADKPSRGYMWPVFGTLIVAYAAGLAGLGVLLASLPQTAAQLAMSWPIGECVNGVLIEYRPHPTEPEFAVVVGDCPLWPGCGCEVDLPWPYGNNEAVDMAERCDAT